MVVIGGAVECGSAPSIDDTLGRNDKGGPVIGGGAMGKVILISGADEL